MIKKLRFLAFAISIVMIAALLVACGDEE